LLNRFGPEVAAPAKLHVAAKRYLCQVDSEYRDKLSPASIQSLELQGGPFTADEAREFETQPYYREAVMVRRWDDEAKIPGLSVPGIDEYRDILLSQTPAELH
jgi:gamma-butyrobetaine dioxygenase